MNENLDINPLDLADYLKENLPELYDEFASELEKEFGKSVDARLNERNIHSYIGKYFIDNPEYLEVILDIAEGNT